MVGTYLLSTKEYASANIQAETPEPQEKTNNLLLSGFIWSNICLISSIFLNVLSDRIILVNGKQCEFGIDPPLTFFLGSDTFPKNLSSLLASKTKNSFVLIF